MTEAIEPTPFTDTVANLDFNYDYGYLLNFWHISKLNRESNYIKRNGLHPFFQFQNVNGTNTFKIYNGEGKEGSIQTQFFTVFRIYLENLFIGYKPTKTRDMEEWKITIEDSTFAFDNPVYNLMYYARARNYEFGPLKVRQNRYGHDPLSSFTIKFTNKDNLYCNQVIAGLDEGLVLAQESIDGSLVDEMHELMSVMIARSHITPQETAVKKKAVKKEVVRPAATSTVVSPAIHGLMPYYEAIKQSLPAAFDNRRKFEFLLHYATQLNHLAIPNTEENFDAFMSISNNFAA